MFINSINKSIMAMVLPKEIAFDPALPTLPSDTSSSQVVLQPTNGTIFGPSNTGRIDLELPSRGFLVPGSLYYRFKLTSTNTGATATTANDVIRMAPCVTPFARLEVYAGSTQLEIQEQYNIIMNDLINLTMDFAQKNGQSFNMGYNATTYDSRQVGVLAQNASDTCYVSFPLECVLSNAEKLIPLEFMQNIKISLITDSNANVFYNPTGGSALSYRIENFELCYQSVQFNSDVLGMVQSMGGDDGKFFVKSSSWALSGQTISGGTVGQIETSYSMRYASIKSLFAHFASSSANAVNGKFDSVPLQRAGATNSTYQFTINSVPYPQRELSTLYNKAGVMSELRCALGGLTSKTNSMSITSAEFSYAESQATTAETPSKFIVGVDTQRLASDSLLTGVSSQNANITLRSYVDVTALCTAYVFANYDLLLEIEPATKSVIARF